MTRLKEPLYLAVQDPSLIPAVLYEDQPDVLNIHRQKGFILLSSPSQHYWGMNSKREFSAAV